jgi:hypothetical protein
MKKTFLLLFLIINSVLMFGQTILTVEGTTVNNQETGTWSGVNIQRSSPTTFTFRNNSITSVNTAGYMLQAGDEVVASTNNNLDGEVITGNKFVWNGTDMTSITHGIFTGHNRNAVIKYNYLNKVPMGIVRKSTNNMTNTGGAVAYNIVVNPAVGVVVKGMSNVNIYNNTFYQSRTYAQTNRGMIDIYSNTDVSPASIAHGTKIKNNIFYSKYQTTNIRILDKDCLTGFECDYNLYWCEAGTPKFEVNGGSLTFAQWQALGYDTHSVVINPMFNNFTDFTPSSRLDYGTNLGATWQTGLGIGAIWALNVSPSSTDQSGTWQVGARIFESGVVLIPHITSAVIENTSPSLVEITYDLSLNNTIIPASSAFSVLVNAIARPISSIAISGYKIQITLNSAIKYGDIITISYVKPALNPLQAATSGVAASFSAQVVSNNLTSTVPSTGLINMTVSPNHVHGTINIILQYPGATPDQILALSPEVIRIADTSGKVWLEQILSSGTTNVRLPLNLKSGIYNVLIFANTVQVDSQKIIVY